MSLVAYASSEEEAEDSEEEEADEEEESEEGPGRSKGLFSALPPPKGSRPLPPSPPPPAPSEPGLASRTRKRTQPVRIAAPQLGSGDSDSEEDEPVKKQPTSQGHGEGTGLSALLPQPKNLTVKETNRPLLPYVFSRKAAEKSSEEPKGPGSTAAPSKPKVKPPSLQAAASAVTTTPSPSAIKAAAKSATLQVTKQITQEENESDEEVAPENYFSLPERREPPAPLGPEPFLFTATVVPDDLPPGTEPEDQDVSTAANAPLEFKTASGSSAASHGWAPKPGEEYSSQPYPPYPGYSEFKRLQGKRNRGREEINFVEIKGDDQLSGAQQWLTKSLTEEQNMKSFSKKKGEQPTGQQRRKHQITYLIHQAKERELELKNTWAENKLSRRQTQAKYGF
ncbi:proline-rich protein PRCC isoform X2 [Anolis carolinensis]|uniref:proline-rich protein PRCC isoform X2 n=1 Tax=Anolis carolinensis TaxID=28377 RepID=UPI002F2B8E9B